MKLKKLVVPLWIMLATVLSGCTNFAVHDSGKNDLKIYNAENQLVQDVRGKKEASVLSGLDNSDQSVKKESIPKDARISYRYVLHKRSHNITITLVVYSNYKVTKISGVPMVGNGVIHLSQNDFEQLNNPNQFIHEHSKSATKTNKTDDEDFPF